MKIQRSSMAWPLGVLGMVAATACGVPGSTPDAGGEYEALTARYVEAWKAFHPSEAARAGLEAFQDIPEDRTPERIQQWVDFNQETMDRIAAAPATLPLELRIDLRLVKNRAAAEGRRWRDPADGAEEEGDLRLGRDGYAEALRLYYDMDISPEELARRALAEIDTTRKIIAEVSAAYWAECYPEEKVPTDVDALVARAFADMEENRPSTQQESLEAFTRFADEAEAFVREAGIATLPADRTLEIVLTPASAGPSQRIGFVASAPPFDPTPMTTLSLPTIEDSFPEDEKEDFYRSFNNHFNKAIIIHELFPGHYMQLKIAAANPRELRNLFPYEPYIEGWATLVEKIALDAGWDEGNKLTYLAHLRKRLENANRAYTSVQLHCFGWTEEEVLRFSEERALLAPQFAKSLWGRLQRGPMQMTSYFVGKDMFTRILEAEKARLGEDFDIRAFDDTILQAGAIPLEMIPELLEASHPGN